MSAHTALQTSLRCSFTACKLRCSFVCALPGRTSLGFKTASKVQRVPAHRPNRVVIVEDARIYGAGVNIGLCSPADAPVGNVPFTDGAPLGAADLNNHFPYLLTPYPGSPVGAPLPQPED